MNKWSFRAVTFLQRSPEQTVLSKINKGDEFIVCASVLVHPWCVCAPIIAILHKPTDERSEKIPDTEQALISNGSPVRDSAAGEGKSEAVDYVTTHLLDTIQSRKSRK